MKRCSSTLALLCALIGLSGPASPAELVAPYCPSDDLRLPGTGPTLPELWDWVRLNLNVIETAPVPQICQIEADQMAILRPGMALKAIAIYDRNNGRILVTAPWDPGNAIDQSVIIHELVHHAQAVSDRRFACPAAAEAEAYDIQASWLARTQLDLKSAFGIDELTRKVLGYCGM